MKPTMRDRTLKTHYRENPLADMSSAIFEIPKSRKVTITGDKAKKKLARTQYIGSKATLGRRGKGSTRSRTMRSARRTR